MENFITGYAGNESLMRSGVRAVLGEDRSERFFERLLTAFFGDADAQFLADRGFNSVRIPVNYRHLEDASAPFTIKQEGFRHLDRAIQACAARGIYSMIDLHALPGHQNQDWHSDNRTHVDTFWDDRTAQDRVVTIWEAIADRYREDPWVSGYNLMNEPADSTRQRVGPYYDRLLTAVRAVDPDHIVFLDGNTYSTEFDIFGEPQDNVVYALHDYVPSGFGRGGPYPGITDGKWIDRDVAEKTFLKRSAYARETETPIMVSEFAPIYTGDAEQDAQRRQILADQLEIYVRDGVSWASWMYKDLGRQGMVGVRADTPYRRLFDPFVAKKRRLSIDGWGGDEVGPREVTQPVRDLLAREFPDFDPYPFGQAHFVSRLLLNILLAEPMVQEYAELLRGLDDGELDALADSFALDSCEVRESLLTQLQAG
ncbi:cellulase family glycosylhydrolase [Kineococcus sp. T13]|uniref:glycoside hydrolase family 5 protein n=1 Tax=Kineococcus vitellinus TaxID=2696565 RepID=UPI001412914F|nr:glycoside hydrolase family 5 protein [Kineococcus vitellinus]NAZ76586.1 cellulase family glycosylhydrolase [Kineococcus vitellinus]